MSQYSKNLLYSHYVFRFSLKGGGRGLANPLRFLRLAKLISEQWIYYSLFAVSPTTTEPLEETLTLMQ